MIKEIPTREERLASLKRAIKLSEEYEESYTKELQDIIKMRIEMKGKVKKIKLMSDEEYKNKPI